MKNNITWIENLRAISCVMVVFLHISGQWLTRLSNESLLVWSSVSIFHSLSRFCVPVFLMISGVLLFNRKSTAIEFYNNRIRRIFKPFLFWSVIYILLYLSYDYYKGNSKSAVEILNYFIISLINGSAYHLWYIYLLFGLYLFISLVYYLNFIESQKLVLLILVCWFILLALAQIYDSNILLRKARFIFGYFGYLLLGYYLNQVKIAKNMAIVISVMLIAIGWFSTFYPVYKQYDLTNIIAENWFYFLNPNIVVLSIGVFLLIKNLKFDFKIAHNISKHSFGIYFVHLLFIMFLNKLSFLNELPVLMNVLLNSLLVIIFSYYSISLLTKIPTINKYVE